MHSDAIGRNKLPCVPGTHWPEKATSFEIFVRHIGTTVR